MKRSRLLMIFSMVLTLALLATPAFAADPNPGSGSADVTVMNADTNTGGSASTVLAQYYSQAGVLSNTRQQNVAPLGSYQFRAADSGLPDNWVGAMGLSASTELAAVATIQWTGGSAGDGVEADSYSGFASGSNRMNVPFAVYAPNAQYTVFSIQNTESATTANITMKYYNRAGNLDATITDSIPPNGQKMYDLHVPGAKIPVWANIPYFQANGNWTGAVVVETASSDQKVAAVANNFWPRYNVAFNASSTGARKLFVPSVERRYTNPNTDNGWLGFSVTIVQNLGSSNTSVTLKYINKDTQNIDLTLGPITLGPGVAVGCNTRSGGNGCTAAATYNGLGAGWVGSVIVESTTQDVAAISYSLRPRDNEAGAYTAAAASNAGNNTFLSEVYQIGGSGDARTLWSLLRLQNVSSNTATVQVRFVNRDGTVVNSATQNITIAGEKSSNFNLRTDSPINLGGNWSGGVHISSNQPLAVVVENLWGLSKLAAYNGYSR